MECETGSNAASYDAKNPTSETRDLHVVSGSSQPQQVRRPPQRNDDVTAAVGNSEDTMMSVNEDEKFDFGQSTHLHSLALSEIKFAELDAPASEGLGCRTSGLTHGSSDYDHDRDALASISLSTIEFGTASCPEVARESSQVPVDVALNRGQFAVGVAGQCTDEVTNRSMEDRVNSQSSIRNFFPAVDGLGPVDQMLNG